PDQRTDIYSVGVIAYELLAGQLPFERTSNMDMILAHATETPPSFRDLGLRSWVPEPVEDVVMSCLEKDPGKRPQSAGELSDTFSDALFSENHGWAEAVDVEPQELPVPQDPNALVYQIDAWLPQRIALMKIRGFVHDYGGQVTETQPGLIGLRLYPQRWATERSQTRFWFGFHSRPDPGRPDQEVVLRLEHVDPKQENRLLVTIAFQAPTPAALHNFKWRDRCSLMFCDLRAYLMGTTDNAG